MICGAGSRRSTRPRARFDPPGGLEGIVVIPPEEVSTERAREAIPAEVPLADAVANVSAASRLVLGLQTADLDLVAAGLADGSTRTAAASSIPRSMELVDAGPRPRRPRRDDLRRRPGGPRLDHRRRRRQGRLEQLKNRYGDWAEVRRLPFSPLGADVPAELV